MVEKILGGKGDIASNEAKQKAAIAKELMTIFTQEEVIKIAIIFNKLPAGMIREIIREISLKLPKITKEQPFRKYLFTHIKYEKVDGNIIITDHDFFDFCEIISKNFDIKFEESGGGIKITVSLKNLNK